MNYLVKNAKEANVRKKIELLCLTDLIESINKIYNQDIEMYIYNFCNYHER